MTALHSNARIAVIGAGAMGAGIAQVAAQAGHPVLLFDNRPGAAAQAIDGVDRQLGKRVEKGKLSSEARPRCQDSCRLIGFTQTEPRGRKEPCNAALLC